MKAKFSEEQFSQSHLFFIKILANDLLQSQTRKNSKRECFLLENSQASQQAPIKLFSFIPTHSRDDPLKYKEIKNIKNIKNDTLK
jgi:hypothetical protein